MQRPLGMDPDLIQQRDEHNRQVRCPHDESDLRVVHTIPRAPGETQHRCP